MNYTLENFINYCDDMMIATEAISFSKIKAGIVKLFAKLVQGIESFVKKHFKDGKIKTKLLELLKRAKIGLSKSKSLREHDKKLAEELSGEAKDIREEFEEVKEKVVSDNNTSTNSDYSEKQKRNVEKN